MNYRNIWLIIIFIGILNFWGCEKNNNSEENEDFSDTIEREEVEAFGFQLKNYLMERDTVQEGDNISLILARHNFDAVDIAHIIERVKDSFQLRKIRIGKTLTLLKEKEEPHRLQYLIYQPDRFSFSVINFKDSIYAYNKDFPITLKTKLIAGKIDDTFSDAISQAGADPSMAIYLSKKFAWSVDFLQMNPEDEFALYFTEKYINDTVYVGIEELKGAYFKTQGKEVYGFSFTPRESNKEEFFDENGNQMKTMFLKSPLKFFRITSKYSKKRLHPVQKIMKAHKGTDYAAPHGTPIMSTADGVVVEAGYGRGNGNYVKVKHNAVYSTQYLHMSKILAKKGQRVKQGQIIGRVGSTGLATGPHVCYRFWKNGEQVDPFKQNLPTSISLSGAEKALFLEQTKPIKDSLDMIINQTFRN